LIEVWLNTIIILFILGGLTFVANLAERTPSLSVLLYLSIAGLNGILFIYPILAILGAPELGNEISDTNAAISVIIGTIGAILATALLAPQVRQWIAFIFPKPAADVTPPSSEAIPEFSGGMVISGGEIEFMDVAPAQNPEPQQQSTSASSGGFRPDSMVHMLALVVVIYVISFQLMSYFLADGLSGIAEDIGINYGILVANFLPQLLLPFLGVGILMRRNVTETFKRLGLGTLSWMDLFVTFASTFGILCVVFAISIIWQLLVSEETFAEQTEASDALAQSINTIGLAFMLAFTAGVGEEIAFRGALQPIFGFWFTAIVFVVSHVQYTLTPATLIIFIVAITFGWLRRRYNTTAAIISHFSYNFVLSILSVLAQQYGWWELLL